MSSKYKLVKTQPPIQAVIRKVKRTRTMERTVPVSLPKTKYILKRKGIRSDWTYHFQQPSFARELPTRHERKELDKLLAETEQVEPVESDEEVKQKAVERKKKVKVATIGAGVIALLGLCVTLTLYDGSSNKKEEPVTILDDNTYNKVGNATTEKEKPMEVEEIKETVKEEVKQGNVTKDTADTQKEETTPTDDSKVDSATTIQEPELVTKTEEIAEKEISISKEANAKKVTTNDSSQQVVKVKATTKEVKKVSIESAVAATTLSEWIVTDKNKLDTSSYFTIGLLDKNKVVTPYTIHITKDVAKDHKFNQQSSQLEFYNAFGSKMDMSKLGLKEYLPYAGDFKDLGNGTLQLEVSKEGETLYSKEKEGENLVKSLSITFSDYKKIVFVDTEGKAFVPATLENNSLTITKGHYAYLYSSEGDSFSIGDARQFDNVVAALNVLKGDISLNNYSYSPLTTGVDFQATVKGKEVTITFGESLNLERAYKEETLDKTLRMIEAMRLTVSSFSGYTLKFSNPLFDVLNGTNLTTTLPSVVGTNVIKLN